MTSKKHFDSAAWQERLQIASDQLRTMVDELVDIPIFCAQECSVFIAMDRRPFQPMPSNFICKRN
jgi:hypothetical protein